MKITAGELHDAQLALTAIINRPRQIPQTAKYRIAKLHSALSKDFARIEDARGALVQKYGSELFADEAKTQSTGWGLTPGTPGAEQFDKEWAAIRAEEIEVTVTPITLESLGNEIRGVEANEFVMLEKFIVEAAVPA